MSYTWLHVCHTTIKRFLKFYMASRFTYTRGCVFLLTLNSWYVSSRGRGSLTALSCFLCPVLPLAPGDSSAQGLRLPSHTLQPGEAGAGADAPVPTHGAHGPRGLRDTLGTHSVHVLPVGTDSASEARKLRITRLWLDKTGRVGSDLCPPPLWTMPTCSFPSRPRLTCSWINLAVFSSSSKSCFFFFSSSSCRRIVSGSLSMYWIYQPFGVSSTLHKPEKRNRRHKSVWKQSWK